MPNLGNIQPERITKPFQLLGTWLLCLTALVSIFVVASGQKYEGNQWLSVYYAIISFITILIFLILIFLLQTKYRPEMLLFDNIVFNATSKSMFVITLGK
jgi:hypothetical protein